MSSLFTKILQGTIPGDILYQDDIIFVIKDINPLDNTHLLIIPKDEIDSINNLDNDNKDIIREMYACGIKLVKQFGLEDGYYLRINAGDKQEVPHIHMHLVSDRIMK
ncbi:HIT domain-containing protein [Candidatus Gracilibacteria bacterium]|nr:HIT domain-containing protein [Candidatus Gracilibacteria bacterium]